MKLPEEFTEKMRALLLEEYPAFLNSYDRERTRGLRVNTLKVSPEAFAQLAPFPVEAIPGMPGACTCSLEELPARHPFYAAGLYYLQEPSAMLPAFVLDVKPGEKVLDLCAAPGGKSTAAAAALKGEGLLVANDVSAARARVLLKNLEAFGVPNMVVTNERPDRLSARFPSFFDRVLVDAPCSGEGMFRKDEAVVRAWTKEKSAQCAAVQRSILVDAADMLRPGGTMVYSTCTFDPQENECVVAHLLRERPGMRLLSIPERPGFSSGFSVGFLRERGYDVPDQAGDLTRCVRLWPHRTNGEGHFLALLGKEPAEEGTAKPSAEENTAKLPAEKNREGRSRRQKNRALRQRPEASAGQAAAAFLAGLPGLAERFALQQPENRSGRIFLPAMTGGAEGLTVLRNGLFLGEEKKDRFEPSQALAMSVYAKEFPEKLNFDDTDERLIRYLRGESLGPDALESFGNLQPGWKLVCVGGYPLGWGRLAGGILKNKLHPGWRGAYAQSDRIRTQ